MFYAELALGEDRPEKGGNRMKRTGIKRAAALAMAAVLAAAGALGTHAEESRFG